MVIRNKQKGSFTAFFLALFLLLSLGIFARDEGVKAPRVLLKGAKKTVAIRVELARTPEEQEKGLMYRGDLGARDGMLFIFSDNRVRTFWMKNTMLPLDMLFIDDQRKIVGIVENAEPYTLSPRTVGVPSRYVLEVQGGFAKREGIRTGDVARFENIPM